MAAVAMGSFSSVDRVLEDPPAAADDYIKVLGPASTRTLLRHLASEQNRQYFGTWEWVQLGLGAGVLVTVIVGTDGKPLLLGGVALMILIVVAEHFLITPYMNVWGRAIDFLPPEAPSPERFRFSQFHTLYAWLEVAKGVIALGLSVRLLFFNSRRRPRSRSKSDLMPGVAGA